MANTVLLDNVTHQDLRVHTGHGSQYGDSVNQVLIFPTEFGDIQREYPIFFRRDANGAYQSVALLGLDRDENLFLDDGAWHARYVPALHQRGPFLIGFTDAPAGGGGEAEPRVLVDLDHPRVASNGSGEAVFLPHGGHAPCLERASHMLRVIHHGAQIAPAMFEAFEAAGIIEPVDVEVGLSETESYRLADFFTVSEDRLAALEGAVLERLSRDGYLGLAYLAAASLGNVNRLIELKNARRAAG